MNSNTEEQVKISRMCCCCDEEKATQRIFNPNWDEQEKELFWYVCMTCKKLIEQQQKQSFGMILGERNNPIAKKMSKKIVNEANKEIQKLSYESGKEVFSAVIERK